jgi:hypothetical protein
VTILGERLAKPFVLLRRRQPISGEVTGAEDRMKRTCQAMHRGAHARVVGEGRRDAESDDA